MDSFNSNNLSRPIPNKRVAYLDMLKCIGMFIVVSGHIHTDYGWFSLTVHAFSIPLFFFLSGLTFRRNKFLSFGAFVRHRSRTLLLPYAMFSVLTWLIWVGYQLFLHDANNLWMPLLQTVIAQGSGGFLEHNVPLWFIPCLFAVECIYYFIDKLPHFANFITSVTFAVIGAYMISGPYEVFRLLPWSLESAFVAIIFYCSGNLLTKRFSLQELETMVLNRKMLSMMMILILTPVLVLLSHRNGHISLGSDTLGRMPIVFFLNAFIGIAAVFLFAVLLCSIEFKTRLFQTLYSWHLFFGRNSFYIMATHVPIKGALIVACMKLIGASRSYVTNNLLCCAAIFFVTCAICFCLAIYINKLKAKDIARFSKS